MSQPGRARSAPSREPRATPTASVGSPSRHVAAVTRPPGPLHRPTHLEPDPPVCPSAPWNMSAAAPRLSSRRAAVPAWSRAGTLTRTSPLDASRANHTAAAYRGVVPHPLPPRPHERKAWRGPNRAYSRLVAAAASHGFRRRHWLTGCPTLRHRSVSGCESEFPCGPIHSLPTPRPTPAPQQVSGWVVAGFLGVAVPSGGSKGSG